MGDKIEAGLASAQDFQRAHDIKEQLAKLHLGFFYFWLLLLASTPTPSMQN